MLAPGHHPGPVHAAPGRARGAGPDPAARARDRSHPDQRQPGGAGDGHRGGNQRRRGVREAAGLGGDAGGAGPGWGPSAKEGPGGGQSAGGQDRALRPEAGSGRGRRARVPGRARRVPPGQGVRGPPGGGRGGGAPPVPGVPPSHSAAGHHDARALGRGDPPADQDAAARDRRHHGVRHRGPGGRPPNAGAGGGRLRGQAGGLPVPRLGAAGASLYEHHRAPVGRSPALLQGARTFGEVTRLIASASDSREVFDAVSRAAATLLGAKMARVWIDDPEARLLRAHGNFGSDPTDQRLMAEFSTIPYGSGVVSGVFESRVPTYISDVQKEPRWLNQRLATEGDLHAFAGIPLISGERVVGILAILFGERRQFTLQEKELMNLLADHAAIAINNARLHEEAERRRKSAEALAEVGQAIAQSLDLEEVGQRIAEIRRTH